nr:hypothetical protein [Endozoicomonas sp.]
MTTTAAAVPTTTTTTSTALAAMILDTTTTNKTGGCCKSSSFNRDISVEDNSCKKLPSKNESAHKPEGVSCSKDPARTKDLPGRSCC